jgi:hypothetical protein
MGTSVSIRSPATSRTWAVARNHIQSGDSPADVLAAMMVAAVSDEWLTLLTSAGLGVYAQHTADAWHQMPDRLDDSDPYATVNAVIGEARTQALTAGGAGVAVGLAERALARVLLQRLVAQPDGQQNATAAWLTSRGANPGDLAGRLLTEVMRQAAMHFFVRDGAAFTGGDAIPDVRTLRSLTRQVGDAAADSARAARQALRERGPQAWNDAVRQAIRATGERPFNNPGT